MRGVGKPIFEHDFPLVTDMMREISQGPYAKERPELEVQLDREDLPQISQWQV